MSFWKRLFRRGDKAAIREAAAPAEPIPAAVPDVQRGARERQAESSEAELERLRLLGTPAGADVAEAASALRSYQGQAHQTEILHAIISGLSDDPGHDPLRVSCAGLLDAHGQQKQALSLLEGARSTDAMMLAAELLHGAGELARALSMVERVLARDIDTPGARERHQRWSTQLGVNPRTEQHNDDVTVVQPSTKRADFRLLREVARGGAGTVYEAEDEVLGRRLAFKVYHRAGDAHDNIEREARSAIRLSGPGVLPVYDAHPEEGWLATEWIARGSLRDILKSGRVAELWPIWPWMDPLLHALERVHAAGLVHGDIKPANVLFRDADDPLLGDFGSCRERGQANLGGTPGYLSPERLDGGAADPRDDVYAVGRVVEDVLGAHDDAGMPADEELRRFAKLALACMGSSEERPENATAVLALLQ